MESLFDGLPAEEASARTGYAGNRIDAEKHALEECGKRTKNAKVVVSFCTNGVES